MFNRNINNYDRFRNTRNITIPNITKPNISIPNIIKPNMFIPNIMKPNMSIRNIIKPNMSIPNIFFNFINLFIFNFSCMKQIIWYMYLMQIIIFPIFLFPGCPVMPVQLAAYPRPPGGLLLQYNRYYNNANADFQCKFWSLRKVGRP